MTITLPLADGPNDLISSRSRGLRLHYRDEFVGWQPPTAHLQVNVASVDDRCRVADFQTERALNKPAPSFQRSHTNILSLCMHFLCSKILKCRSLPANTISLEQCQTARMHVHISLIMGLPQPIIRHVKIINTPKYHLRTRSAKERPRQRKVRGRKFFEIFVDKLFPKFEPCPPDNLCMRVAYT